MIIYYTLPNIRRLINKDLLIEFFEALLLDKMCNSLNMLKNYYGFRGILVRIGNNVEYVYPTDQHQRLFKLMLDAPEINKMFEMFNVRLFSVSIESTIKDMLYRKYDERYFENSEVELSFNVELLESFLLAINFNN